MSEVPEGARVTMTVVGVGGAGCNTLNRLKEVGAPVKTIAIHTEANHLKAIKSDVKLLVGETVTGGFGSGGNPNVGERAIMADLDRIMAAIGRPNVLIVTGGLGGGTASGGVAPILSAVRDRFPDVIRIALVSFPFSWEGLGKVNNARYGLSRIMGVADLTIVNLNDILSRKIGYIQVQYAFKYADSLLAAVISDLANLFYMPHVVSISFADFEAVVREAGLGAVGLGVGGRVADAAKTALGNILLDAEIKEADSALVYLQATPNTSLEEAGSATKLLTEDYLLERVYWGFRIAEDLNEPRITVIASGVRSPTLEGLLGISASR